MSKTKIGGIIQNSDLVRVCLMGIGDDESRQGTPAAYSVLLERLGNAHINVDFIVHWSDPDGTVWLIFRVSKEDWENTRGVIQSFQAEHPIKQVCVDENVASIGIYGPDFRIKPGLAGALMKTMHMAGITIQAISTSLSTFTMFIPVNQRERALSAIQQRFELP